MAAWCASERARARVGCRQLHAQLLGDVLLEDPHVLEQLLATVGHQCEVVDENEDLHPVLFPQPLSDGLGQLGKLFCGIVANLPREDFEVHVILGRVGTRSSIVSIVRL